MLSCLRLWHTWKCARSTENSVVRMETIHRNMTGVTTGEAKSRLGSRSDCERFPARFRLIVGFTRQNGRNGKRRRLRRTWRSPAPIWNKSRGNDAVTASQAVRWCAGVIRAHERAVKRLHTVPVSLCVAKSQSVHSGNHGLSYVQAKKLACLLNFIIAVAKRSSGLENMHLSHYSIGATD